MAQLGLSPTWRVQEKNKTRPNISARRIRAMRTRPAWRARLARNEARRRRPARTEPASRKKRRHRPPEEKANREPENESSIHKGNAADFLRASVLSVVPRFSDLTTAEAELLIEGT